jgi:hypothetical protein
MPLPMPCCVLRIERAGAFFPPHSIQQAQSTAKEASEQALFEQKKTEITKKPERSAARVFSCLKSFVQFLGQARQSVS